MLGVGGEKGGQGGRQGGGEAGREGGKETCWFRRSMKLVLNSARCDQQAQAGCASAQNSERERGKCKLRIGE